MKKLKKSRILSALLSFLLVINIILSAPLLVSAATTDIDASGKSTANPPQSITGKAEIAEWTYNASTTAAAVALDFPATAGYYTKTPANTNSTLQLFKNNPATKITTGFTFSTSSIKNSGFNGQTDKAYWLISTSTKGFKDLVFNFNILSSGTGPRDFNTEWSKDASTWNVFGNTTTTSPTTVKIETTSQEPFGMVLPAAAANQDILYIRIIQRSETSEGGNTVASGGTHGLNNLQLYGAKDPAYTTPTVTVTHAITSPILDVTPITLSCTDTNAQIFYTTDGTVPATAVGGSTKLYSAPFTALSEGGFSGVNPFVVTSIAKSPTLMYSDVVTSTFNQQTITSNSDAKKLPASADVWVKGIGTYLNGNTTLYIQDGMNANSGLCIYMSGADFSPYVGKEIYVHGKTSIYNGLTEITPATFDSTTVVVRNSSPTVPTPTKIMLSQLSDRSYEGMLVSLDTVKLATVAGTTTTTYYNHTASQAGVTATLRAKGIASSVGTTGSYVNIINAIANYNSTASYNGAYLLSTNTTDLQIATTPTVEFMTANVATGTAVPLNSKVTLATTTANATITYSLNGGAPVPSATNSADVTIDAFPGGKATITATASNGTYTTATQTFTYTQSQVAKVTANPDSSAIVATTPITLSSTTANTTIAYSLYKNSYTSTDGTLVGSLNQIYTAPITVDASYFPIRIVAKATLTNYADSDISTFTYTTKKSVGGEKNYYGSIHAHTAENSDGQGTLAEADAYARDQGKFDYFILTDHSNSFDKAAASDTVASIGNLNTYNTTNQQWINGKQNAAAATTANFLCDYGYEMTWSGGPGHINTFNTAGFVSRNNTILNNKTNDAGMQAYYQLLKNTPGSISQFNHPGPTFGNFSNFAYYDPTIDDKINLIEVGNGEGAVGSGGYFPSIDQYILALDKGWHVAPTNNGDNHKKGWGTSNTCATVVYTNDYTMSGIYQAMRDRSIWATENRDLDVTYHLNDGTNNYSMGAILAANPATANITVTAKNKNPGTETSNIASIQLIGNSGMVVNKKTYATSNSDVTYTYAMTAPTAGYYFAKITDNQGFVAVTAPIWLGSAPKVGITSVINSAVMPATTEALNLTTTFFNNESTAATLKSITYSVDGDTSANKSYDIGTSITSLGSTTHIFSYTPTTAGTKTVNISAVITVNGIDTTYTTTSTMKVVDINKVLYVGLDASHGNEYVSGGSYPNSMTNMMTLAANNGVRVVQLNTSQDFINACNNPKYKMMILNAPSRKTVAVWPTPTNYTLDETTAIKTFSENGNTLVFGDIADYAEASNADVTSPKKHMSELQNDVLTAIGSTLREGDDEVMDDDVNGGQAYRLYPTEFNMANPLLQGVVNGQTYSQYSGSTIYAVDPKTGQRTTTVPSTVSPLVYGLPSTYSAECDNDNFGYGTTKDTFPFVTVGTNKTDKGMSNSQGIYIPKYINPKSNVGTNPEEKLLAASENVVHSNGKTSLVVVAGGSFMSNFEIQVTMENSGTLPYANYNLMDNLYKVVNPETVTSIADAKSLADGTDVIIEATATNEVNTQNIDADTNKGFFDCIYAQDATGGINLFPIGSGIKEGQKARFYGKITHYQGEVELTVTKFNIIDQDIKKITPTTLTTNDTMLPTNTGLLVKTQGVVSNIYKDNDGTINQFTINDKSGPAIVFINGYITKGTVLPFITDGVTVSVEGLASIGEVVSDSDMHPRIRVRDRSEIANVVVNPGGNSGSGSSSGNNGSSGSGSSGGNSGSSGSGSSGGNSGSSGSGSSSGNSGSNGSGSASAVSVKNTDTTEVVTSINAASNDAIITLDVSQNRQIGKELFDAIKGTNKAVVFEDNGIEWTFNAKDITGDTKAIDTTVNIASLSNSLSLNKSVIAEKMNNKDALIISFANNGQLPGKATIRLKLDADQLANIDKSNLNVYYYNETTKAIETIASNLKVDENGYLQFDITHNSDYIISGETLSATEFVRLSGNDRYETSIKISQSGWKTSDNVVLATGEDFPDALSAAPFAKKYNAPMLITNHETLNPSVEKEIERLGAKNVFIIGSTGAIAQGIEDKLVSMGIKCTRIKGNDRYETSAAIADYMGASKEVVVVTGTNFPDALSIASYAALKGIPILLTKADSLPESISKYIAKVGIIKSYVIGGAGVIKDSVLNALPGGERLSGSSRYDTNLVILQKFAAEFDLSSVYFATGENFPDALTGLALAASMKSPIILVNSNISDDTAKFVHENISKIKTGYALGGNSLVADSVKNSLTK